jgi:EpsI family protein
MRSKRLALIFVVVAAGLCSAFFVPNRTGFQPVGVKMDLPESIGQWTGTKEKVTQAELDQLASDTTFARKVYSNAFGDHILVSIVLAGEDPDNSIHRPERCLPAQGWTIMDSRRVAIPLPKSPLGQIKATRLHNEQDFKDNHGQMHRVYNLNYYWFVGYNRLTPSHIERALLDIHDRVLRGYNQRWAYVTVASNITEGLTRFGRSEQDTDQMIQSLIRELLPRILKQSAPTSTADGQLPPKTQNGTVQ